MILVIWLGISIVFALAAAFANRMWGTVLAAVPVAGWFVYLFVTVQDGIAAGEGGALGLAIVAVVLGLCTIPLFERMRSARMSQLAGEA